MALDALKHVGAVLIPVIHVGLATWVAVHALLHKRDTSAAVGWIGIAWLSPVVGSVLYFLFGINRVQRRASRLSQRRPARQAQRPPARHHGRDDHLAPLERLVRSITGRPAEAGNDVIPFHNGDEAYPAMLEAIEGAQRTVALSSYIFRGDAAGYGFVDALVLAHRRGVGVKILIDGIGGGYFISPARSRLRQAGVDVRRFLHSPLPWRMPFLNLRNHRKILVVDGSTAFVGGLNIGQENVLSSRPRHPVRDVHFRMRGPVVAQITEIFADDWLFTTGEQLSGPDWFPPLAAAGDATARAITSGPDEDFGKTELVILQAIACARRTVKIMTPYFLPDEDVVTALALAAMRGVEVDVVVPGRTNHRLVDWALGANAAPLVRAGVRIWRGPPPFNHSKLMTVDGLWCLLGSANWDVRSFRLNFEVDVEIYGSSLVQKIDAALLSQAKDLLTARELTGRTLPRQLRDAAARLLLPYL